MAFILLHHVSSYPRESIQVLQQELQTKVREDFIDYAKQGINPQKVDMKLGHQCRGNKGQAVWLALKQL